MLTAYMRRLRNNNLGLGLRAPLCRPQLDNVMTIKKPIIAPIDVSRSQFFLQMTHPWYITM